MHWLPFMVNTFGGRDMSFHGVIILLIHWYKYFRESLLSFCVWKNLFSNNTLAFWHYRCTFCLQYLNSTFGSKVGILLSSAKCTPSWFWMVSLCVSFETLISILLMPWRTKLSVQKHAVSFTLWQYFDDMTKYRKKGFLSHSSIWVVSAWTFVGQTYSVSQMCLLFPRINSFKGKKKTSGNFLLVYIRLRLKGHSVAKKCSKVVDQSTYDPAILSQPTGRTFLLPSMLHRRILSRYNLFVNTSPSQWFHTLSAFVYCHLQSHKCFICSPNVKCKPLMNLIYIHLLHLLKNVHNWISLLYVHSLT